MNVAGTLGANGWYVSDITVTLQASSPSGAALTTAYSLDSGGWTTHTQTFPASGGRLTLTHQPLGTPSYVEKGHTNEIQLGPTLPVCGETTPHCRGTTSEPT